MARGWGGGMAVKWNRGWRDSGTAGWVETKMAVGREERPSEMWRRGEASNPPHSQFTRHPKFCALGDRFPSEGCGVSGPPPGSHE